MATGTKGEPTNESVSVAIDILALEGRQSSRHRSCLETTRESAYVRKPDAQADTLSATQVCTPPTAPSRTDPQSAGIRSVPLQQGMARRGTVFAVVTAVGHEELS